MIVLDIETIPLGPEPVYTPEKWEGPKVPANYKDQVKIQEYLEVNREKQWNEFLEGQSVKANELLTEWKKGALKAVKSQIICICALDTTDGETYKAALHDEQVLLLNFCDWLYSRANKGSVFCGHNIRFDLQMLRTHACLSGILEPLKNILTFDRFAKNIEDTMEIWAGVRYDDRTKLTDIASYLGLAVDNGDTTGADIYDLYKERRLNEIETKCMNDVLLTYEVWKRIR